MLQGHSRIPRLELQGLKKSFGSTAAVAGVNLELMQGEFLTFLGPSGSGKTTTLAMVAGLQKPTAGRILLDSVPLDPLPPYRRNIGMVFQHYALFPHLSVARNIAFPLEMRRVGRREIAERVAAVLALVGLDDLGHRYPRELSGGQQQRVALARALVFRPPLLLMDEPLGALDKKLREQMQLEIMRLHRELGVSILYVTHDQGEALVMSDRIAVFKDGRIEQIGRADELYERPATGFVAGFLGDSNFFEGSVRAVSGSECLVDCEPGPLRGHNTARLEPHDKAILAIRPEHIRLSLSGKVEDCDNILKGRVSEIIYVGQARKYVIDVPAGGKLLALQQACIVGPDTIQCGDEVTLGWRYIEANILGR